MRVIGSDDDGRVRFMLAVRATSDGAARSNDGEGAQATLGRGTGVECRAGRVLTVSESELLQRVIACKRYTL